MLRSHARNGNEFQTPCHRHSAANIEIPGFETLQNPKCDWESWNLAFYHGEASACFGNILGAVGACLGLSFTQTRASLNKRDDFGRERGTFGDETISVASYCFQKNSSVNIEQQECCVQFWNFSGFVWTFLCINWVFNAFMCIIQIWTTCTCSNAYKLVQNSVPLVACLGPMQEMGMNVKHPPTVTGPQNIKILGL